MSQLISRPFGGRKLLLTVVPVGFEVNVAPGSALLANERFWYHING